MLPKQIIYPINYSKLWSLNNLSTSEIFQANFSKYIDSNSNSLPLGRARAGIYLFVKRFICGSRNKVILSPYTIPDVINMVLFAGGVPVFVDTLSNSTNIDVAQLCQLIDDQTACVMITHYHVNQTKYLDIVTLCEQLGVELFEDCAIALGGQIDGKALGSDSAGGIFSLSSFKFLNFIWGGVISTHRDSLYSTFNHEVARWPTLRRMDYWPAFRRTLFYDLSTRPKIYKFLTAKFLKYQQRRLDRPVALKPIRIESSSLDRTLTARPHKVAFAEWNRKFENIRVNLNHRRQIATVYSQYFSDFMVAKETDVSRITGSCFVNYPIAVSAVLRDRVYKQLLLAGYDVGLSLYPNVHEHPSFKDLKGYSANVSKLVRSVITLPTHPLITVAYAEALSQKLLSLL